MAEQGAPGDLATRRRRDTRYWAAWIAITAGAFVFADAPLARAFSGFSANWLEGEPLHGIIVSARNYGQAYCIAIILALVFVTERTRRRELARMAMGLALAALVMHLAKDMSGRARPEVFLAGNPAWQVFGGFHTSRYASFPSAHTMSAFALSGALAAMYPKGRPVFFAAAAVCGLTRILDNQHYLSDVMAGGVLGWWMGAGALRWRWTVRIAERLVPAGAGGH